MRPTLFLFCALLASACIESRPDDSGPPVPWPFVQPEVRAQSLGDELSFRGVAIPSDDVIWVSGSGGSVFRSVDGGHTFGAFGPAGAEALDFRSLYAFDADRAWVASAGPGEASQLFATVDGGVSWTQVLANEHPDGFWDALAFWDERHGILVGDATDGFLTILTTADGGATWRRVPRASVPESPTLMVVDGADEPLGEYCFAASNQSVAVGPEGRAWIGTGGAVARLWRSDDFGATWTAGEVPLDSANPAAGVFAVHMDGARGLLLGGTYDQPERAEGNVAHTRDNGATWRVPEERPAGYRSSVTALPRVHATAQHEAGERSREDLWGLPEHIAVGTTGVSFARMNGRSWEELDPARADLNAIAAAPSGAFAIAVGRGGQVVRLDF